jgi:H+-translocating NAD(P) transhydrogenase subunit alpha
LPTLTSEPDAMLAPLMMKNLYAFLEILIDKKTKALAVNWDDDIVTAGSRHCRH